MEASFQKKLNDVYDQLGASRKMVLATSLQDHVTARTMSVIICNGRFYFQTDRTFRKYRQLAGNANVALCYDNVQVEGVCREVGAPMDDSAFCEAFKAAFPGSFHAYTALSNERFFEVVPVVIQRWLYEDGKPFVEQFDLPTEAYCKEEYVGE